MLIHHDKYAITDPFLLACMPSLEGSLECGIILGDLGPFGALGPYLLLHVLVQGRRVGFVLLEKRVVALLAIILPGDPELDHVYAGV